MSRLATIIFCLIISIISGFLLLWPQYQKFDEAKWQVKGKEKERDNQEEYFAHIESLSKESEGYPEETKKILSALPSSPDVPDLLNFLHNASSNNSGMNFEKITSFSTQQSKKTPSASPEEESNISGVKEITVEFNVSGDYAGLKNFISTLEKSARIIEVESISFKKQAAQTEGEAKLLFSLKIKAFYY